jgi:hypothetical protein
MDIDKEKAGIPSENGDYEAAPQEATHVGETTAPEIPSENGDYEAAPQEATEK